MKTKRIIGFLCFMLFAALMLSISVFALSPADGAFETGGSRDQLPEYTSGYDDIFVSGQNGWGQCGYQTGNLFTLFRSRAFTEVWGDHALALNQMEPYAYARIRNLNNGSDESSTNTEMNAQRNCAAYTPYIWATYATNLNHIARLKVNGTYNWPIIKGYYNLP